MNKSTVFNMRTTCWRWSLKSNYSFLILSLIILISLGHIATSSKFEQEQANGDKSLFQEDFNFHPEYWHHLERAQRYAKCVEKEVQPVLDEYNLIMRPASCGSSLICNECIQGVNQTKVQFSGFKKNADSPIPLLHCTSHVGVSVGSSQKDFKTYFRIEYPTPSHPNASTLRMADPPRIFVVEKQVDGKWEAVILQLFWLFPLETKAHSTYRVRVTAVSANHVYYPQLSDPITLYDANTQTIGTPTNFRVVETLVNTKAARTAPTLILRWESGSGMNASCDWDIYYLEEVQKKIEQSKPEQAFWAVLDKIQFEKTYTINIMEKFGFGRESGPAHIIVNIESCLTLANFNLSLCPPPPPANVRVENETESSFWIAWDGFYDQNSISQISYYNITVDKYMNVNNPGIYRASKPLFKSSVPGNQTRIEVKNITGPQSIKILVVAKSIGGMSEPSEGRAVVHYLKDDVPWTKSLEKFWVVIVIVVILLMTIVVILYLKSFRDRLHRNKEKKEMWKKWDEETPTPHVDRYSSKWEIDFGSLVLHDVVGKGQFGEVRKATLHRKGCKTTVAVKTLRVQPDTTSDDDETEDGSLAKDIIDKFFREEFEILTGIEPHQHVVGLVGLVREPTPALVVQFCDGGDLQTHLRKAAPVKVDRKRSSPVPSMMGSMVQLQSNAEVRVQLSMVTNEAYFIKANEDIGCSVSPLDLLSYARQVACGMEFLSNNKIIHRDLAARNILIKFDGPEKNRVLKIADFGLSRDVYEQNWYKKRSKGKIPVKWLAIECLLKEVYTTKSDVWSYGVLLWEIVTFGATPYPGIDNVRMYDVLKDGYRMTRPENCSKEIYDLMTQCWDENPNVRPDFTTIRRKIEELIGNCGDAANYLNLDSTGTIQYSELMEPLRIDPLI